MTGREADLASHLVVGLAGPGVDPTERAWLDRWRPAGVILFARNIYDEKQLCVLSRELHTIVPGLEIVADHEGGPVSVLAAALGRPPAAATLGLLDDPELTRRVHAETARAAAACGIDRLLAPVADVLTHGRNPVIGVRAFGADPVLVSRHVAAAVTGLREGGVRCCVKHWPGHGGTAADSHREEAREVERPPSAPFAAALAAGADAVMVAHLTIGALPGPPATLTAAADAALRRLTVPQPACGLWADDLTMGALRAPLAARGVAVPRGEGMVDPADLGRDWIAAVAAGGCDRLLVRGIPWRAFPLADSGPRLPGSACGPAADARPVPGSARAEARSRLSSLVPGDFARARTLAWIDRTADDRWGPAAAEGGADLRRDLAPRAAGPTLTAEVGGAEAIIVTSHRPLEVEREGAWARAAAPRGFALGVGHPSLAADLRALLPSGWRVAWLPEWPGWPPRRADQKI